MNRTIANIIFDRVATFLFLGMMATGYLVRFPFPPGSNKTLSLWGLTRRQWGDIHFWISLGLLVVLAVHLVLHWNWIVTVIGNRCHLVKTAHPSLVSIAPSRPSRPPGRKLASSQFLVRFDNESKCTMAAACGSLAREWLESGGLLSPARAQSQNLFTMDAA